MRATPSPVRLVQPTPAWWDKQIEMPKTAEFIGDAKRAIWGIRDTNVNSVRDYLLGQAGNANYKTYTIVQSPGAIYDLLFIKGQSAFALNLTLGSDTTIVTVQRTGVMHLSVTGIENIDIDLPMRIRVDVSPGSEVSIGASVPSSQCGQCEYFINVHIAPFKGVGHYDAKPGIAIVDVELVPGGNRDLDNYRWAIGGCVVTVKETTGNFECKQLQNINDQTKRVDVSGSWTQP